MRTAIVSDIHGNLAAFEAVLADLEQTAPDLILHGGDLPHGGSAPVEIVDRIRDLGWSGVLGNTDEMLFGPQSLTDFAAGLPQFAAMWAAIEEMAAWDRDVLGADRLDWLRRLPLVHAGEDFALVHASPLSTWRAPAPEAADAEFESAYAPLARPTVVYGHIHRPFVRAAGALTIANSGSVSLSYDGDPRASYLLLDDGRPTIRRVEYDVQREIRALQSSTLPHAGWCIQMLRTARPAAL